MSERVEVIEQLADAVHDILYGSCSGAVESAVAELLNAMGPIGLTVAAMHGLPHEGDTPSARIVASSELLRMLGGQL